MSKVIGDWAAGPAGWMGSDPWEQGWQKTLLEVVSTNTKLHTYGSSGKMDLLPVPEVAGATDSYLYLKDCGEFDTEKYQYDLNYLHYAFGVPVGVTGKDANDYIDNILLNEVGIVAQKGGSNSLSATGNTNGLHAYNDYDWNLVSKEISAKDGNVIQFGWSFQGGDAAHGADAAFWVLKEVGTGRIIASDLLAQGSTPANGIAEIVLPSQGGYGTYILTIGQMNVGTYNGDQAAGNPHLLIGSVVQGQDDSAVGPIVYPEFAPLPIMEVIGDWSQGLKGWEASDPFEQGWHDYLFEYVNTNVNLHGWGTSGKVTLPPVPEVEGATGKYLYLKDCGEFDTQSYQYDLNFLNQAFGLPVGVTGKAANNYIDDILLNVVGIAPQKGGSNSLSATGNANGLHAYNDYDWNLVSKEIDAVNGGVVKFGWSFLSGDAKHGDDAAFWVLKDAVTGQVLAGETLAQGGASSGIAEITLPILSSTGHYVLTIGQMNVGTYNSDQIKGNPHMLIGSIVLEHGNDVVTDNFPISPTGLDLGGFDLGLPDIAGGTVWVDVGAAQDASGVGIVGIDPDGTFG